MTSPADKTILVVDDEPDVRTYLEVALKDAGFNVITAQDGLDALERLKETVPDLISLDLVMPRKTGNKFLYEMRKNKEWSCIPVLIVTAHSRDEMGKGDLDEIMQNMTLSGPGVIEKPVNAHKYVNAIKTILNIEIADEAEDPVAMKQALQEKLMSADKETLKKALEAFGKK
jgi:DNA-binding response OmpR family regulator